eukprot:Hpha_TRINITY_DN16820_c6_g7::TRINITY_DN16820_c6_g7_i2::g.151525::m.151525
MSEPEPKRSRKEKKKDKKDKKAKKAQREDEEIDCDADADDADEPVDDFNILEHIRDMTPAHAMEFVRKMPHKKLLGILIRDKLVERETWRDAAWYSQKMGLPGSFALCVGWALQARPKDIGKCLMIRPETVSFRTNILRTMAMIHETKREPLDDDRHIKLMDITFNKNSKKRTKSKQVRPSLMPREYFMFVTAIFLVFLKKLKKKKKD